ncbi:MAG: hypothetical protein K9L30_17420 [Desulfobacterales bacterium]|nr:hypothetical protein [Desulfobacterales bacterium]
MQIYNKKSAGLLISCILISSISFWIYSSFIDSNVWSISIYTSTNPYELTPHPLIHNVPVLTAEDVEDVPAKFVADPFMIYDNNKWYMFFEVLNTSSDHGDIGLASSKDGVDWQYEQIVLDESFHLSYPYVFKWNESHYMIPESREGSAVKLYQATDFPYKWALISDIITGNLADPSIVYKNEKWWLFALSGEDTLVMYFAGNLTGPWTEHPKSPIVTGDMDIARPGGRHIVVDDKIIRYVQDCDPEYGNAVRIFQVDVITTTDYKDHEISKTPVLSASGSGWNAAGMHHVDAHQLDEKSWISCVDGKKKEVIFDLKIGAKRILKKAKQLIGDF